MEPPSAYPEEPQRPLSGESQEAEEGPGGEKKSAVADVDRRHDKGHGEEVLEELVEGECDRAPAPPGLGGLL
jgi:hypothetical protein